MLSWRIHVVSLFSLWSVVGLTPWPAAETAAVLTPSSFWWRPFGRRGGYGCRWRRRRFSVASVGRPERCRRQLGDVAELRCCRPHPKRHFWRRGRRRQIASLSHRREPALMNRPRSTPLRQRPMPVRASHRRGRGQARIICCHRMCQTKLGVGVSGIILSLRHTVFLAAGLCATLQMDSLQ